MKKIVIIISVLLFFINGFNALAVTLSDADREKMKSMIEEMAKSISDESLIDCKSKLSPLYDAEMVLFLDFLEQHFNNTSSTSSLLNNAIARYGQFKNNLMEIFLKLRPNQSLKDSKTSDHFAAYDECFKLTEGYLQLAKDAMIEHVRTSNIKKQAGFLVDKYKAMNDRLRDLNFKIARMYGFFMTFKNRTPGFLSKCIVQ